MKAFFLLTLLLVAKGISAATDIYVSSYLQLQLDSDGGFIYYNKEAPVLDVTSGEYVHRNDSLILTTHEHDGLKAIFAIFDYSDSLKLLNLYSGLRTTRARTVFPKVFVLLKKVASNGVVLEQFEWLSAQRGEYIQRSYSPQKELLSIQEFKEGKKQGMRMEFLKNPYQVPSKLSQYKEGKKHGKVWYFEPVDETFNRVYLTVKEKYKKGKLRKIKTLAIPPVLYTNHFLQLN